MRLPQAAQVQAVIASDPLSSTTVRTGPAARSACPWRQFARLDVAAVAMETNRRFFMDDMGRSSHRIEMKTAVMLGYQSEKAWTVPAMWNS